MVFWKWAVSGFGFRVSDLGAASTVHRKLPFADCPGSQGAGVAPYAQGIGSALSSGLCMMVLLLSGCAPRTVAIPPDWLAPPPQAAEAKPRDSISGPPAALGSGGGILKSTPSFREGNLPAAQEPVSPQSMKKQEPRAPQQLASMHLVDQAKTALSQGKHDAAIPLLEQAIQIDAYNGEAFFGLARAWKMKGSRNKAQEFAQKAEVLLQDQPAKLKEVYAFQADLFKELGDTRKMESYRRKASAL